MAFEIRTVPAREPPASVRLDTGSRQPHARALYESVGYMPIERYNDNPFASYWAEKAL